MAAAARPAEGAESISLRLLVTGEMALAVVLLAGAGVMIRSFLKIHNADWASRQPTSCSVRGPACASTPRTRRRFPSSIASKLVWKPIPGVESVAMADQPSDVGSRKSRMRLAGAQPVDERQPA